MRRARRGGREHGGRFGELHEKGALAEEEVVFCTHAHKDGVRGRQCDTLRRQPRAHLRQQCRQAHLRHRHIGEHCCWQVQLGGRQIRLRARQVLQLR